MKLFKISLIIIAFMAASCEKEAAFKQKKTFENQNWLKFDKLLFQIPGFVFTNAQWRKSRGKP